MPDKFEIRPHHCGISVPDIEASIAWYEDVLGFAVAKRMKMGGGQIVFLKLGDFYIELFEIPGSRPSDDMQTQMGQDLTIQGTKHVAFTVENLAELRDYLEGRGVTITVPEVPGASEEAPPADEEAPRALFIRDNSGVMLEFVPPTAPE